MRYRERSLTVLRCGAGQFSPGFPDLPPLKSVGHSITEQFARRLIQKRLLPEEEFNDGLILAETALAHIPILATADKHLLDIEESELMLSFDKRDLSHVAPLHPKRLLRAIR